MLYGEVLLRRLLRMRSVETTGWKALFISVNAFCILFISIVLVVLIRRSILPPVAHFSMQLDFIFETCGDNRLSGVCSFPTATIRLIDDNNERIITAGIAYAFIFDAHFVDSIQNRQLGGPFITLLQVTDADGRAIRSYPKSAIFRYSSGMMNRIRRLLLLPFYLLGWTDEVDALRIEYTRTYYDNPDNAALYANLQIQNQFVQFSDARLTIVAQMGALRSILYDWPILSSVFMLITIIVCLSTLSMIYWAQQFIVYLTANSNSNNNEQLTDCPNEDTLIWPKPTRTASNNRKHRSFK